MIYSWLYVLCNAIAMTLVQISGLDFPPILNVVFGSLLALLYFNLINIRHLKKIYLACWQAKMSFICVNLLIFFIWYCSMYGPTYVGASVFSFLGFATIGFCGMLHQYWTERHAMKLAGLLGVLVLEAIVTIFVLRHHPTHIEVLGILFGYITGVCGYWYFKSSSQFANQFQLSATQVLAMRFFFAILLGAFLLPKSLHPYIDAHNLGLIVVISCMSLIIPIYFAQMGLFKIGPDLNAIIISTTPVLTAIVQALLTQHFSLPEFIIYLIYCFFCALPYVFHKKKQLPSRLA